MLAREAEAAAASSAHPCWRTLTTRGGLQLHLNAATGAATLAPPPAAPGVRGGFFCDEPVRPPGCGRIRVRPEAVSYGGRGHAAALSATSRCSLLLHGSQSASSPNGIQQQQKEPAFAAPLLPPGYVEMCDAAAGSGEDNYRPGAGAQVARPAARAAARRARRAPAAPRGAPCRLLHAAHGGRGRAAARPSRPPRVPARRAKRRQPHARGHRARCRGGRRPCRRGACDAACGA